MIFIKNSLYSAFFFLSLLLLPGITLAQTNQIKGKVTDESGQPLPKASVLIKGTSIGTFTAGDGTFTLNPAKPSGNTLLVSSVGYKDMEVSQQGNDFINVQLKLADESLNSVVVVGYGTQKRSDISGSVATIKVGNLVDQPTADITGMLRGQVPGLNVTVNDARPGGSSNVLLRGIRSLKGSNSPLYVVDGVPITTSINDLDIDDIASISVLKDASSQAIYGSRASNGVILITTKRGSNTDNKVHISYGGFVSYQNVHANFSLYSPQQYIQLRREAYRGDLADSANGWMGTYPDDDQMFTPLQLQLMQNNSYVNWLDYAFNKNAPLTKHNISINGGNKSTQYSASLNYFDQSGVRPQSGFKKYSGHASLDQKISTSFKTGLSFFFDKSKQQVETAPWLSFITFSPLSQLYDSSGNLNEYPTGDGKSVNPLYIGQKENKYNFVTRTLITSYLEFSPKFIPGLKYRLNASLDERNTQAQFFASLTDPAYIGIGNASITFGEDKNYLVENILTYDKTINNNHKFDVTLVQSFEPNNTYSTNSTATQLGNDYFGINSLSSELQSTVSRSEVDRKLISYVGRVNYAFKDKYLFDFAVREDGSSVFGSNNKWGVFPSAAVAWNVSKEKFTQNLNWLSNAKVRLSYGEIGNQAIPPYGSLATAQNAYYVSDGTTQIGYLPGGSLPNPNLKWETTTTLNVGLDFGIFENRVNGTVEYYKSNTTNLLVSRQVPAVLGYSSEPSNLGEIQNKGFEATVTGLVISKPDFSWSVTANFSVNRNKLVKGVLQDPTTGKYIDDISNEWFIGHPINVAYDYKVLGIWQINDNIKGSAQPTARPGDVKVEDVNGDGVINASDRVIINKDPDWIGSFMTYFRYKGIDFSASVYTVQGGITQNQFLYDYNHGGRADGVLNGIVQNYWTPENPTGTFPRPHAVNYSDYRGSLGYQSTTYIRLRNVTIGYDLPDSWLKPLGISKVNIYASGDNLWTQTKYQSYSPEEANADSYPETINFSFGIKVNL